MTGYNSWMSTQRCININNLSYKVQLYSIYVTVVFLLLIHFAHIWSHCILTYLTYVFYLKITVSKSSWWYNVVNGVRHSHSVPQSFIVSDPGFIFMTVVLHSEAVEGHLITKWRSMIYNPMLWNMECGIVII